RGAVRLEELVDGGVVVGEPGGVTDPGGEVGAGDVGPAGPSGVQGLLDRAQVDGPVGGDEDQIAAHRAGRRGAADVGGFAEEGDVSEGVGEGRRLRAGEGQLAVVDEVGDVEAVVVEHPPHVGHRLRRGQVPGDADAREGVADDQV